MAILYCYSHVVVKNGNLTLLLISRGQQWHIYRHLVVNSGNFTLLLTSSGPELTISHCLLTSSSQQWQFYIATDI